MNFFGSIFGTVFIIVICVIILVGIIKLFKINVSEEDIRGCFTIIGYIALAITFIVFILNKCSSGG